MMNYTVEPILLPNTNPIDRKNWRIRVTFTDGDESKFYHQFTIHDFGHLCDLGSKAAKSIHSITKILPESSEDQE